jgi:MFS family permease
MLFCFASISAARVALVLYALTLGASPTTAGLLAATFYAFPLFISLPIGIMSDRFGSRWLLLFGAVSGTLAMLIPYFIHTLTAVFAAGILIGFAFSFYNVLLQNIVGLLSRPEDRARNFANSSLVGATANLVGPLLAGFSIDHWGHAVASLCVAAVVGCAVVLLLIWGHVLPGGKRRSVSTGGGILETLKDPAIVKILATSGLVQVGQDLFQLYIPVYGSRIGLSASAIGGVIATFAFASFVVRFAMPRLVAKFGEEPLLGYSFFLAAIGFALVPLFENGIAIAAVAFIFGLGMGCGQPVTTMLLFSRSIEGRSGETLGLRQAMNNLMRVGSPPLFGFIASAFGLFPVFWINAVMMGFGSWLAHPGKAKD